MKARYKEREREKKRDTWPISYLALAFQSWVSIDTRSCCVVAIAQNIRVAAIMGYYPLEGRATSHHTFNLVAKSSLSISLISQDFESINSRPG